MKAATRRVYDMCGRVLSWASAHPDEEAGTSVLVAQIKALTARIAQVITEQRNGLVDSRAASVRKRELRREMLAVPIAHLAEIGALAARERHELGKTFRFKPTADTYVAFQSAARGMYGEAQSHKEVLVQHGLSESVLVEFGTMLDEFDAAVALGAEGRTVHTAATRELDALTKEVGRIVRAMDARNRVRFRNDRPALEQWVRARTVLGTPRGSPAEAETPEPGAGGERRDAGCGRRGEARGMNSGVGYSGAGCSEPPPIVPTVGGGFIWCGVVLDFDAGGSLVGLDIDQASHHLDLSGFGSGSVPVGMVGTRSR